MSKALRYALAALSFLAGLALIIISLVAGPVVGSGSVFWLQVIIGAALMAVAFAIRPR